MILASAELRVSDYDLVRSVASPAMTFAYFYDQSKRETVLSIQITDDVWHVCLRYDGQDLCVLCGNEDYSTWPK